MVHAAPTAASTTRVGSMEATRRATLANSARRRFSASSLRRASSRSVTSWASTRTAGSRSGPGTGKKLSSRSRRPVSPPDSTITDSGPSSPSPRRIVAMPSVLPPRSSRSGWPSAAAPSPRLRANAAFAQRTLKGAVASTRAVGSPAAASASSTARSMIPSAIHPLLTAARCCLPPRCDREDADRGVARHQRVQLDRQLPAVPLLHVRDPLDHLPRSRREHGLRWVAKDRGRLADRQGEEVAVERILRAEAPHPGGGAVPPPHGERLVQHEEALLEHVDNALVELVQAIQLDPPFLELGVQHRQLDVDRLQLLDGGLELLVGRLELLVGGLELLVGRLELLVGGLELLVGRLELLVGRGRLLGDAVDLLAQARLLAHVVG